MVDHDKNLNSGLKNSPFFYAIITLSLIQICLIVLSLTLPWGKTYSGSEIRSSAEGLLPWFLIVPVLLQVGLLFVRTKPLAAIYLSLNFIVAAYAGATQIIALIRYSNSVEVGFYMVFPDVAIAILAGLFCVIRRRRLRES